MTSYTEEEIKQILVKLQKGPDDTLIPYRYFGDFDDFYIEPGSEPGEVVRAYFSLSGMPNQDNECFPGMECEIAVNTEPGDVENEASSCVFSIREYNKDHGIIVEGYHAFLGSSDESHAGIFNGTMSIVEKEHFDKFVEKEKISKMQDELAFFDNLINSHVERIIQHSPSSLKNKPLWENIKRIVRHISSE